MRLNLATLLAQAVEDISKFSTDTIQAEEYIQWVDRYQAQLVVLASQITWSTGVEDALQTLQNSPPPPGAELGPLLEVLKVIEATLNVLADSVLHEQPPVRRKKLEHLVRKGVVWCGLMCCYSEGGCGVILCAVTVRVDVVWSYVLLQLGRMWCGLMCWYSEGGCGVILCAITVREDVVWSYVLLR